MSKSKKSGNQKNAGSSANGESGVGSGSEQQAFRPEWKPNVEFFTGLSQDGRYVICKTIITAIKPVRYFEKVLEGKRQAVGGESHSAKDSDSQSGG